VRQAGTDVSPVARGTLVRRQELKLRGRIHLIRGAHVMLDADVARLYDVSTKRLNKAVGRNLQRFPNDFMFRITGAEAALLKSQIATSKPTRGGRRRSTPRAFTEQGIAMLSGVLRRPRAVAVNVELMLAFVRLRRLHGEHADLVQRIAELESRFDSRFRLDNRSREPAPSHRSGGRKMQGL